jgi:hypothetical protein
MQRFFDMRIKKFYYRIVWKHLMINRKAGKEKKRIRYYFRNALYRKKLQRLFKEWQKVSHSDGKDRITREEKVFRKNLETEKLTMWTSKVD